MLAHVCAHGLSCEIHIWDSVMLNVMLDTMYGLLPPAVQSASKNVGLVLFIIHQFISTCLSVGVPAGLHSPFHQRLFTELADVMF